MSTSTAIHRTRPAKPKLIPHDKRHILEAPCDLCGDVAWVTFRDGLCGRCVAISALAVAEDRDRAAARTRELSRSRR